MNTYTLNIRKKIAEIELANNDPCTSLNQTAKATIVLGSTGSGKTTILEFLSDKELTVEVKYGNPYLDSKSSQIGHGGEAKTDRVMIHTFADNQVFIDTPGFGDTRGEYTEIKNHIAIRNVVECSKIEGVRMIFVVPKSVIFYEANRGSDLIKFIKSVRNFIPDFSAKKWIDQTFIVVTKTETRTTTSHAIEAIKDGIEDIKEGMILTTEERQFFKYLMDNQKVKLFPMPREPYKAGEIFQNIELRNDILNFIKQTPTVKISKDDFSKEFQLSSQGEIVDDFSAAKESFVKQCNLKKDYITEQIKSSIQVFPKQEFSIKEYNQEKKILENYINNFNKICEGKSSTIPLKENSPNNFNEIEELISIFCELDFSANFFKKYTSNRESLFTIESEGEKLLDIIGQLKTYYEWMICTTNAYKSFFYFLAPKDNQCEANSIDEILRRNKDPYKFFEYPDELSIRNSIIEGCAKAENIQEAANIRRKLDVLREGHQETNSLDKLIKLVNSIAMEESPQYQNCTIKGFIPKILQHVVDNPALSNCKEIAIYGVYGIQIAGPLELEGKNLIMIAPHIKVVGNQSIKLNGIVGARHSHLEDDNGKDGAAGNVGENGGSLYGYCFNIIGGKLTVSSRGGDGSDGQNGGNGKNGLKGKAATMAHLKDVKLWAIDKGEAVLMKKVDHQNWNWYTKIRCADTGEEGEEGGKGGTGGEGGKGGLPGEIDFQIKGAVTDKGMYFSSTMTKGKQGQNGEPGKGGEGGAHGDAICYLVEYVDTNYFPYFMNPAYGYHYAMGQVPKDIYRKKLELPKLDELDAPNTYNNMQYPSLIKHEKAANGDFGGNDPVNKSKAPSALKNIKKEEHIKEYTNFILKAENIHEMIDREDTNGNSLYFDNEDIIQFFQNFFNADPLPNHCDWN